MLTKTLIMKKIKRGLGVFLAVLAIGALLSSCSVVMPVTATSNPVGSKVGTATATGYLGYLFFDQDASIQTAARNGVITKISGLRMIVQRLLWYQLGIHR